MSGGTLRKRGEVWYGRIRRHGKEFERSLETGSKTVARERLGRWIDELKGAHWGEKPRRSFDETVLRYIKEHFPTLKPATARRYHASLQHLIDHFGGLALDEIGSEKLNAYQLKRRRQVQAPTIRRDLACLRKMFACARAWEWTTLNPAADFLAGHGKGLKENQPRNRVLSHQEEADLIASAIEWSRRPRGDERRPVPWHILIPVAIDTGLRKEELFGLQHRSQLKLDRAEIFIPWTGAKAGRDRAVPVLPRSRELLSNLPVYFGKPWVFHRADGQRYSPNSPYVWESFKKIARNAGIEDLTVHDLRRTCGCRLLRDLRMSMEEVSKWLGHSSIKVTERVYAFLEIDDLHQAVERTRDNIVTLPRGGVSVDRVRGFSNKAVAAQRIRGK
jgi:integrase